MFCSNCGASNYEGSRHCSNCGRVLQPQAVSTEGGAAPALAPQQSSSGGTYSLYVDVQQLPYTPTDGKATASLVLGILSLLGFTVIAAVPAVILGHMSRKSIKMSAGRLKGKGVALGGLITGYIGLSFIPILIVAFMVMPNPLRARQTANGSSAQQILSNVNSAQVLYSNANPEKGYAMDLATLGSGQTSGLDRQLSRSTCISGAWCVKNKYKYSLTGFCNVDGLCKEYVAVATPVDATVTTRSFCSTSDAVIRSKRDRALAEPLTTADECSSWEPFQGQPN